MKQQSTSYIIERQTLDGDWRHYIGNQTEYRISVNAIRDVERYRKQFPEEKFRVSVITTVYETTVETLDEAV